MSQFNVIVDSQPMTVGTPQGNDIRRDTVVVVMVDESDEKFLCQYWQAYDGLTCLLSGGIEQGETSDEAVLREIKEETGFSDFTVIGRLGAEIQSYYTKKTGENFVKYITPYFVILHSHDATEHAREEDENFENLFKKPVEIESMMDTYEQESGSSLADHREILRRGAEYFAERQ